MGNEERLVEDECAEPPPSDGATTTADDTQPEKVSQPEPVKETLLKPLSESVPEPQAVEESESEPEAVKETVREPENTAEIVSPVAEQADKVQEAEIEPEQ